jgi:hypothetical protein
MEHSNRPSAGAGSGHEDVFAYWSSLRDGGRLPARAQIDPWKLKKHLPNVSLIDVLRGPDGGITYRQRLAGTGLYMVYGREITGRALDDVYPEPDASYWHEHLRKVVEAGRPAVGRHTVTHRPGGACPIVWIRLPLASDGATVDMILGYDMPLAPSLARYASGIRAA